MSGPTRRQWIVLVGLFLLSLPAVTARIYSSDEIQYFAYLRSLWFDHDLSFENEYQHFYDLGIARSDGFHETFLERTTDTGRRINFGTIGCAILWAPFYAVGDLAARLGGAPADGFSKPYVAAVAYGSAAYGFLAIVLAVLAARRLGANAFTAALAVWLGTPLLFYMYVAPPFSHACSAFGVALFTWTWLRVRERWTMRGAFALGAAGALMAMIREQDVFFALGAALDFGLTQVDVAWNAAHARRVLAAAAAGCAGFLVVFTPQAASYIVVNGHLGPHASVGHKMNWAAPHALQVLFSPEHGFFIWTPLALIAIAGICFLQRKSVAICLLLMVALQVYVGGSVESWTVAGAFGQRRFIALTTALILGYAALEARLRSAAARRALAAVAILFVYWNLALTAEFAVGLMDRQRLEPAKNAYDAFFTLPRMAPGLVYRYLFDRASFYRGPAS
ncbi:MAG TPA: hypothetical protein VN716_16730 [Vicinamibacterales bacterium]|nr:hypothetical protein [Vicinamibacterales bacterium]